MPQNKYQDRRPSWSTARFHLHSIDYHRIHSLSDYHGCHDIHPGGNVGITLNPSLSSFRRVVHPSPFHPSVSLSLRFLLPRLRSRPPHRHF